MAHAALRLSKMGAVYSYFRQWNNKPELAPGETEGTPSLLEKLMYEQVAASLPFISKR